MGKSYYQVIEDRRLNEVTEKLAAQRAARLAAEAAGTLPKRKPVEQADTMWMDDVRACIQKINSATFTLTEVYDYMDELEIAHPQAILAPRSAVRHTLQKLRDAGEVLFDSPGCYTDLLFGSEK
jgi:hypothetical protein